MTNAKPLLKACRFCNKTELETVITTGSRAIYCVTCGATGPRAPVDIDNAGKLINTTLFALWNADSVIETESTQLKISLKLMKQELESLKHGTSALSAINLDLITERNLLKEKLSRYENQNTTQLSEDASAISP